MQEIIAHRGASAYAPEHTLEAYDLALQQGAGMLELDVRVAGDGSLVVVHDETLLRTIGDPRRVADVAPGDLDPALRPLTLQQVVRRYARRGRLLLDLKQPSPTWEPALLAAIDRIGVRDRVVVQSFDHASLRRLHAAAPWLPIAALFPELCPAPQLDAVARFACGVGPWFGSVDGALVAAAHARGLEVRPWTVNDEDEIARLLDLGVDGVITDIPDVAVARRDAAPVAVPLAA